MPQDIKKPIEEFARLAREYCHWADSPPQDQNVEARKARLILTLAYKAALSLPEDFGEEDPPSIPQEEWKQKYGRFSCLPIQYYSQCFNPLVVPAETPVTGDLADDLADIWRDLAEGLSLFEADHIQAAAWQWRHSFANHWGHHATSALYALHVWFTIDETGLA